MANDVDLGYVPKPSNTVSPVSSFMVLLVDTRFTCKATATVTPVLTILGSWCCYFLVTLVLLQTHNNRCWKGMVFGINPTTNKSHEQCILVTVVASKIPAASYGIQFL